MSLSQTTIDTVKATVPVLKEHAVAITSAMYDIMWENGSDSCANECEARTLPHCW